MSANGQKMPGATPEHFRENWGDERRIAARRRWQEKFDFFNRPATEVLLRAARPRPGEKVLDVACGMGEPALLLAEQVGPAGHVTASDFEAEVLAVGEERARKKGLLNLTFRQADAQSLPFPDQSFDLLTCRFGIMFFPEPVRALREGLRALRTGGRAAFLVWGTAEQPLFRSTFGVVASLTAASPLTPDSLPPCRFAKPGTLSSAMEEGGFVRTQEETHIVPLIWPGKTEEFWEAFSQTAILLRTALDNLSPEMRNTIDTQILNQLKSFYDGRELNLPATVIAASGIRG